MRATPPSRRMSAGTRSSAITATAPASSAILAWVGVDHVHDDPALEHLGQPALDELGSGVVSRDGGRTRSCPHSTRMGARDPQPLPPGLDRSGAVRRDRGYSSRSSAMRSSRGGWVSNMRLMRHIRPSARSAAAGCSIHRWAVRVAGGVDDRRVVPQLLQRGDEPRRVAGHLDARHVGQRLAAPAHRELHHRGDDRRRAPAGRSRRSTAAPGGRCCRRGRRRSRCGSTAPCPTTAAGCRGRRAAPRTPTMVTASVDTRMS